MGVAPSRTALPTPDPDTSNTNVKCGVAVVKNRYRIGDTIINFCFDPNL